MDHLACLMAERRKELHLTQEDLAQKARVSRQTVIALEQGRSLQIDKLRRILDVLGMTLTIEKKTKGR
ncbi:MAG: helix-turn-helix transcriptional regulator [Burkholderiales bacterium]